MLRRDVHRWRSIPRSQSLLPWPTVRRRAPWRPTRPRPPAPRRREVCRSRSFPSTRRSWPGPQATSTSWCGFRPRRSPGQSVPRWTWRWCSTEAEAWRGRSSRLRNRPRWRPFASWGRTTGSPSSRTTTGSTCTPTAPRSAMVTRSGGRCFVSPTGAGPRWGRRCAVGWTSSREPSEAKRRWPTSCCSAMDWPTKAKRDLRCSPSGPRTRSARVLRPPRSASGSTTTKT